VSAGAITPSLGTRWELLLGEGTLPRFKAHHEKKLTTNEK
jgi:hypothetical protein